MPCLDSLCDERLAGDIYDLTRQLSFLMNNYRYEEGEDPENECILIPRYKALGRTAPNGTRYPDKPIGKPSEEDLVPVRSIITKSKDPDIVTPDLIGTKYTDFSGGSAIGLSFGTSLTESITQGALALKHGGHERKIQEEGYMIAPGSGTIREEGKWIIFEGRGKKELKYPRPENFVRTTQTKFSAGDLIGTAYTTVSPIIKLNSLIKLLRAKGNNGVRYFEKENVIISDCYALEDGVIKYTETKDGEIVVSIGKLKYDYNPECMYYYPDGTEIKKFQRFCSGIVNMGHVISHYGTGIQDIYQVFRKQVYTIIDGGFLKKGVTDLHSTQEELIEMLFISLLKVDRDPKTEAIENIEYLGTGNGVLNNNSFYTILSYGYSGRVIGRALKGDVKLTGDVMTETILGLLLNNRLDDPGAE
jgi:hypothetical protein